MQAFNAIVWIKWHSIELVIPIAAYKDKTVTWDYSIWHRQCK